MEREDVRIISPTLLSLPVSLERLGGIHDLPGVEVETVLLHEVADRAQLTPPVSRAGRQA